jgi:hypothetical protein
MALSGCGDPLGPPPISEAAAAYLDRALDVMEEHSINRYTIEWGPFRERAFLFAVGAQTPGDTYDAIRFAVYQLGDNHSSFREPSGAGQAAPPAPPSGTPPNPDGQLLEGRIGYVRLYGFSGSESVQHADTIQGTIRQLDSPAICGWIVDVRLNTGGNMWPMVAGIGPILGEGQVGAFVDPDSIWTHWFYDNGGAGVVPNTRVSVSGTAYELNTPEPTVAVLTGPITASSGEAVVVAFRERPKTRSFGQGTYGVSTANSLFTLSDGAELILTVSTLADRTRHIYGGVIEPDQFVDGEVADDPASGDAVVDAALAWLTSSDDCGGAQ